MLFLLRHKLLTAALSGLLVMQSDAGGASSNGGFSMDAGILILQVIITGIASAGVAFVWKMASQTQIMAAAVKDLSKAVAEIRQDFKSMKDETHSIHVQQVAQAERFVALQDRVTSVEQQLKSLDRRNSTLGKSND